MARIARVVIPECPHHVTQRGVRSMALFKTEEDKRIYLEYLKNEGSRFGVRYVAYCFMTNHIHLVVIPKNEESLAWGIGEAHRRYTRMVNLREGVQGHLFQERFFSCPLDERHFVAAVRYVERNPVRAQMVTEAWQYEWSSARYHVGKIHKDKLVEGTEWIERGNGWKEFLSIDPEEIEFMRKQFRTGRPCGDEKFMKMCERLTGRLLWPKKPGPKCKKGIDN